MKIRKKNIMIALLFFLGLTTTFISLSSYAASGNIDMDAYDYYHYHYHHQYHYYHHDESFWPVAFLLGAAATSIMFTSSYDDRYSRCRQVYYVHHCDYDSLDDDGIPLCYTTRKVRFIC